MKSYIDIVKHIIDNYNFTTYDRVFTGSDYHSDDRVYSGPTNYFQKLFTYDFYKIQGTNETFHDKEMVNFLKSYEPCDEIELKHAIENEKKTILQMDLHPYPDSDRPFEDIKKYLFDELFKDKKVLDEMQNGDLILFLYQGWEAENFSTIVRKPNDKYKTYYKMFEGVIQEYNLPISSIVIANSNLLGDTSENKSEVKVIYDNIMEQNSFNSIRDVYKSSEAFDINYSIDEYLENIKSADNVFTRLNRTPYPSRDMMLYYLHRLGYENDTIIDHKYFNPENVFYDGAFFNSAKRLCQEVPKFRHMEKYFDIEDERQKHLKTRATIEIGKDFPTQRDIDIINKIESSLPFIASPYEQKGLHDMEQIHPNNPIPFDIYKNSIVSWVSVSLPGNSDKVFINQSTFNPILHFHPLIFNGHQHTIKYFKEYGFESYDWLFDEYCDKLTQEDNWRRLVYNITDVQKIMNMGRDNLVDIITQNKDSLERNRNLLVQCKSIERIITKFYETTI